MTLYSIVKIPYGIIYWPPPSKKYSRTVFVHGIQWQLSFNTQNIYISQTILFGGWHFFNGMCVCGGGSIHYGIIYWPSPPPSKKYSRTVFVHGIQWQLSFKTQNIYISQTILLGGWHFFLMGCGGGGGGVNILWNNILTPPPLQKNIQEQFLYMESSDN